MTSSPPVTDSRKRPRGPRLFSSESLCFDCGHGVHPSCKKPTGADVIQREVSPSSSSSSTLQPLCVLSSSVIPFSARDMGSSSPRCHESLAPPLSSRGSAIADAADSTTGSTLLSPFPHECFEAEQQLWGCASSKEEEEEEEEEEEAESCCGENDTTAQAVDVTCFLWHDVWEDAGAFAFDPETVFLGTSTDCSDDAAFADCSSENGNWFLNDLESEGRGFLNEVLDQEWMAAAVANLDRINDTLDADLCVLHLLESDHADKGY